jgi:hypothetical protein
MYFPPSGKRIIINSRINEIIKQFRLLSDEEFSISFELKKKIINDYNVLLFNEIDCLDYKNSKFFFKDIPTGAEFRWQ